MAEPLSFSYYELTLEDFEALARDLHGRGEVKDERPACNFAPVTLDLDGSPLFFSFVQGVHGSITSQIAVKMSLETMVDVAMESDEDDGKALVQQAFKEANAKVFEYGQRMVAGGQVAATGFAGVVASDRVTIARAGNYESYLWRDGKLLRFYEGEAAPVADANTGVLENVIGAHQNVLVDIAATALKPGDIVVLSSFPHFDEFGAFVSETLAAPGDIDELAIALAKHGARVNASASKGLPLHIGKNAVLFVVRV